jgi:hypothetical protein
MARKVKRPAWKVEALLPTGAWGWVLVPPFRSLEEAQAAADRMHEQTPKTTFRAVRDEDQ